MFSTPALAVALAALVPLMAWTAWSDLKSLRIPNAAVLGVVAVFLVVGLWGLPADVFLWRLGAGAVALLIGFGLFAAGALAGGDAKMIAALVPFFGWHDALSALLIYAVAALALLLIHRLVRHYTRNRVTGWVSLDPDAEGKAPRFFPLGLILAVTTIAHLGLRLAERMA